MAFTIGIDARKAQDFGIGTYVRNLIAALARIDSENRYLLFAGAQASSALGELPPNFQIVLERSPVYSLRELVALSWKLLRLRLDLYHATHYVLPATLPCRAVVTIHDIIHLLYPEFLPSRLALLYAQSMIRRSLLRGSRIIAVSHNTRADLMDYFAVDGEKIEVIHNGVEEVFRQRLDAEERDRKLAELGVSRPYLLFVGNPKPHKNLDNVVRAYARARELYPFTAPLVCAGAQAGAGGAELRLAQQAAQLGIRESVLQLGHVAQELLPALYQGATLFLYPTLYEGFGLPVVEAMASGVPVVTSHNSALREVAEGYAELVDPMDVEEIAVAIALLMAEPERRQALARRGEQRAAEFRWELAARKTLDAYRAALAAEAPKRRFLA